MKVLWICHFSNPQVRKKLNLSVNIIEVLTRKLLKKPKKQWHDYAAWITNGIEEFEKFDDVELHVVSPHYGMSKKKYSFQINRINYHFFKPDDDSLICKVKNRLTKKNESKYNGNRKKIRKLVNEINPDIIHMYGAENPYYSISALDVNINKYPLLISLQTLMSDPDFKAKYPIDDKKYLFRSSLERQILKQTTYIASTIQKYKNIVWSSINPNAIFLNATLAVEQNVMKVNCAKKYDFVYFAASIAKSADIAVEAFAIANKKYPLLTLNIIGETPEPFTSKLKKRINYLGINENIKFSGKLPKHKDVLEQIQLSKYALLPLKIDILTGTIREAIYAGLPVVTTITPGTPLLNTKRNSILISEQDNYQDIANNMIKLIESPELCKELSINATISLSETYSNIKAMNELATTYKAILDHFINNTPIPTELKAVK